MRLDSGTEIGRYSLLDSIGTGPMGHVYRAADTAHNQVVALKLLPRALAFNAWARANLRGEVHRLMSLQQPGIVRILQTGMYKEQAYFALDYMTGGSLAAKVSADGGIIKQMPVADIKALFTQIAPALTAAHGAGLIHGNLKPSNILFDADGRPAISDFGLGQFAHANSGATRRAALRSVRYVSPEHLAERRITAQSDIYTLGILLYELSTGYHPFAAATPAEMAQQHVEAVPPKLHSTLDTVLQMTLAKDPTQRPPSVHAFVAQIPDVIEPTRRGWRRWFGRG